MGSEVKWIKIVTDIFDDEKILLIESLPESDSIIVIWFKLLCLAGKQNNSGVFVLNDRIPYTDKMLATIFRRKEATVTMALNTFEQFGMIERIDGVVTIPNWGKHQTMDQIESRNAYMKEYMQKYRGKQRAKIEASDDCKVNSKVNSKLNVNTPDIDIEREEERECLSISKDIDCRTSSDQEVEIVGKAWNQMAAKNGLATVRELKKGSKRYSSLKARISQYGVETVLAAIDNIDHSPFLLGQEGNKPFFITFDWFVLPNNFIKVSDGNYLDRAGRESKGQRKTNNPFLKMLWEMDNEQEGNVTANVVP